MSDLIIHCGGERVEREQLDEAHVPAGTRTWTPVAHGDLIRMVEESIERQGLEIRDSSFALARNGQRMFGVIRLAGGDDYSTVVGVRNSHDKSFPASLCLGSSVFVCDNLAFSSEVVVKTKHSRHVMDRLPALVGQGVSKLIDARGQQDRRIAAYKATEIRGVERLHNLLMWTYRGQAIPARAIPEVLREYDEPRHPEFKEPTAWSYFNACTEVLKNYGHLPARTQRLHQVVDTECNLCAL